MVKRIEAEDIKLEEYRFSPTVYKINNKEVIDFTGIEHDKIFLVNKKDILNKPRPDWIPEFDSDGLSVDSYLPVCAKDEDGSYFVISKKAVEIDTCIKQNYRLYKKNAFEKKYYRMSLNLLAATVDYYIKYRRAEMKLPDAERRGIV